MTYTYPWHYESTFVPVNYAEANNWTPVNQYGFEGSWGSYRAGWQASTTQFAEYEHSGYNQPGYHNAIFEQRQGMQNFRGSQHGEFGERELRFRNPQSTSNYPTRYSTASEEREIAESRYFQANQQYAPYHLQYQPRRDYVNSESVRSQPWLTQEWRTVDDLPPPPPPPSEDIYPQRLDANARTFIPQKPMNSRKPRQRRKGPPSASADSNEVLQSSMNDPSLNSFHLKDFGATLPAATDQRKTPVEPTLASTRTHRQLPTQITRPELDTQSSKSYKPRNRHLIPRPKPSTAYLKKAYQEPVAATTGQHLLVVLDLNGTVLYRRRGGSGAFVSRPGVSEFLDYLFNNHHVLIWSSAMPNNVERMCSKLLSVDQRQLLIARWARDKLRIPPQHYHEKVQVYKQLSWIWEDEEIKKANPDPAKIWSQENTVLIDDSPEKAASEPHNVITLEEFEGRKDQMESEVLFQVVKYLETLRFAPNVSAYIRQKPFAFN